VLTRRSGAKKLSAQLASSVAVSHEAITIRAFTEADIDAIVAFSLRAWEPVYESIRPILGDPIYLRLHPDWRADQAEAVRSACTNTERDVFVALVDARPAGFVAIALDAFHQRMGAIEIIGVDPDYQRRGVGERLTSFALGHMRERGMDIAVVETGGDPGHEPARALYAATGFTVLPISRYFKSLR
jgi:ribosomal protein S18 acetylase RimI-like enzyme